MSMTKRIAVTALCASIIPALAWLAGYNFDKRELDLAAVVFMSLVFAVGGFMSKEGVQ